MNRKKFVKKSLYGFGGIVALPLAMHSCSKEDDVESVSNLGDCMLSPSETPGPFVNRTPAELVRENIVEDRKGVALLVNLTVQDQSNDCKPMANVYVDLWHCDAEGAYSQYGGIPLQEVDYTNVDFLRGRQMTDVNGKVSFISIYPGWYPGRAPHMHLEVLDADGKSIRISQIAFPDETSEMVYQADDYVGSADTTNAQDGVFAGAFEGNMPDSITGDITNGYILDKAIVV